MNWLEIFAGLGVGVVYSEIRDRLLALGAAKRFKTNISDIFYFNLERCVQMSRQLKGNGSVFEIPSYAFDTDALRQVVFTGRNFMSQEIFDEVNWRRYQLDHLNLKLGFLKLANGDKGQLAQEFLAHLSQEKAAIEAFLGRWK